MPSSGSYTWSEMIRCDALQGEEAWQCCCGIGRVPR